MAILTTSLYVVAKLLPPVVGSFRFFWGPLVFVMIILNKPSIFSDKVMWYILIYWLLFLGFLQITLWKYMLDWDQNSLSEEFYALLIFTTILLYFVHQRDFRGLAFIGKLGFIFILVTILMTHVALTFDPYIIRQSASPIKFTAFQAQIFKKTGAGGYGYMQALVIFLPILIYHIKYDKKLLFKRRVLIVILILLLALHIRTQVFANIIVSIIFTILAFAGIKKGIKSLILIAIIISCILLIPISFVSEKLMILSSYFEPDTEIHYKLNDFAKFILTPDVDSSTGTGSRAQRYLTLYEAFLADPIFGNASYNSSISTEGGGHLHWMNRLSIWGIFGFSFYFYMLSRIYKKIRNLFHYNIRFYYFLSVAAFISLGFIKTISGREPFLILIVVIPGILYLPFLENGNERFNPQKNINTF